MNQIGRKMLVGLSVLALAVPAAAVAKQDGTHGKGKGKGHAKTHNVAYVFKGIVTATSLETGEVSLEVKSGNSRVRKGGLVGTTVAFTLTETTPVVVADVNADTKRDLGDVQVGDRVLVKCKLPKSDPGGQPFAAKRLVDQTHPAEPSV